MEGEIPVALFASARPAHLDHVRACQCDYFGSLICGFANRGRGAVDIAAALTALVDSCGDSTVILFDASAYPKPRFQRR